MGCEVILPRVGIRGEITEHYFTKLCLYICLEKALKRILLLEFFVWSGLA